MGKHFDGLAREQQAAVLWKSRRLVEVQVAGGGLSAGTANADIAAIQERSCETLAQAPQTELEQMVAEHKQALAAQYSGTDKAPALSR